MVTITKTFSFKPSDEEIFKKAQKILDKKNQHRGMSKLVIRLLKDYVKKSESPKTKSSSTKPRKFLTESNFQSKCPSFFSTDSVWWEYLECLKEAEHKAFELQLQEIPNSTGITRIGNNPPEMLEKDCPSFFSDTALWKRYLLKFGDEGFASFKKQLNKILEMASTRGHEIYKELGME